MMDKLILIGFMGAGKTRLGQELALQLNWNFYDLDQIIEQQAEETITQIFENQGEAAFRKIESSTLENISSILETPYILACGGGTPCFSNNMEKLKHIGPTVYLQISSQVLAERLIPFKKSRPLIQDIPDHKLDSFIDQLLQVREPFYLQSDYVLQKPDLQSLREVIQGN